MPISEIRPAQSKSAKKGKKLQSTVLPGGEAPEPEAYLEGIVKSEPGMAVPSQIRSQAKLMPKENAQNAKMVVVLSNGKMKVHNLIKKIFFSGQAVQKSSKTICENVRERLGLEQHVQISDSRGCMWRSGTSL